MNHIDQKVAASISASQPTAARRINPLVKLALEFGPLALFFIASARYNLYVATATLMVGVVVTLAISFWLTRRVPTMPLVTAVAVLFFGALTFYFNDPTFIKLKPTIVNCLFGAALLGGLIFNKPLLPILLDSAFNLDREGWQKLSFRWGLFFFFLAALNEVVWRTQTDVFWAAFKVFGTMPITIVFALCQVPLIMKHELKTPEGATTDEF
ncbi:septation protein A [Lichenihabitans sp. PAMC28606]|uniref:septation protein A n=1 Tax=Lichenihabitans sp. PAMC28606 TaxID=2880932 RepID=UPI001D0A64E3|nr:septation protein A [Lichenihabitans sp. PAMC28606]UDL93183.1 septation protein A [Lichenihabitans sp. PAMC28606]